MIYLDHVLLTPLVRNLLHRQTLEIVNWQRQSINSGRGSATGGVYRIAGLASDHGEQLAWTMMLKVLSSSAQGNVSAEKDDIAHPLYWKREALVYQSGLLNDLPHGLTSARCLAIVEQSDGTLWLWLEEATDSLGWRWPLAQYERVARLLAKFNAMYLHEQPMYSWLTRNGSPRGVLDHFAGLQDVIRNPKTWDHPLVRAAFPIPVADHLLQLWADRAVLLDAFERLPYTFCHLDAWRGNLFAPHGIDGPTVVIDWAYPGCGAIGTDIGDLMGASYGLMGVEPCTPAALDSAIFNNYLDGLYEAGWHGDQRVVRFAYATFVSLKYAGLLIELRDIFDEASYAHWEKASGQPMAELIHNKAALIYFLLDLADEARKLMQSL